MESLIDGFMQKRRNFSTSAMGLRLCWIKPSTFTNIVLALNVLVPNYSGSAVSITGLLPDTLNCRLRMRQECRERFPRRRFQKKPPVNDPDMHQGTCVTHVPWCMSGSLTCGDGEKVPLFPAHAHPQFCVSGKRPMVADTMVPCVAMTS